jgi:serine/threonine protein kinase
MRPEDSPLVVPSSLPSDQLEDLVDRFEEAWRQGRRFEVEALLASAAAGPLHLLVEFVHIDLEYRTKAGEARRVEAYLKDYPLLGSDVDEICALAMAEFQLRRRLEPSLTAEQYYRRFPAHAERLRQYLQGCSSPDTASLDHQLAANVSKSPESPAGRPGDAAIQTGGEPIPGYRLLHRLGSGGFGEVWVAQAPGGLAKAIKIVRGDLCDGTRLSAAARQEFKSLQRVQSIRHPYLLSLERYDIVGNCLVIVMELADGSLWDRYRECRLQGMPGIPRQELLRYVEEAAEALDLMALTHGLQHQDIKPQNLLLCQRHVKVADFGLVKDMAETQVTRTGGFTPLYSPPELFEGMVSRYCDQYSLALVFQELLTGVRAFNGSTNRELALQHLHAEPNLTPLPPHDRPTIARALAKLPDKRFPSCADFVRSLRDADCAVVSVDRVAPQGSRVGQEVMGDGALFPALVIGLGGQGLRVLQRLHGAIEDRFGSLDELPQLRLVGLDTNSESEADSPQAEFTLPLPAGVVLPMPLRRANDYRQALKESMAGWLDPRALGRL